MALQLAVSLSAECISSIEQIIKSVASVCVSQSVSHLKRVERSTGRNLHQTCHQGRGCKSEISMSVKPEVELIFSMTPMEK